MDGADVDLEQDARVDERTYAIVENLGGGRVWIELHGDPSPASPTGAHTLYESVDMRTTHRFDIYERTVA